MACTDPRDIGSDAHRDIADDRDRTAPNDLAAQSSFECLYESDDGKLVLFETDEGHLVAVDSSRLA